MSLDKLHQLAYISSATHVPSSADLQAILDIANSKNQEFNISGFLMYVERSFFQIIEGPKAAIDDLYNNLLKDTRHCRVTRVLYNPIENRRFADWSMAFLQYDKIIDVPTPGYSHYLHEFLASGKQNLNTLPTDEKDSVAQLIEDVRKNLLGL